jgi:hypothetical protein
MTQYSDCCNAPIKWTDICSECGEHCDPMPGETLDDFIDNVEQSLNTKTNADNSEK